MFRFDDKYMRDLKIKTCTRFTTASKIFRYGEAIEHQLATRGIDMDKDEFESCITLNYLDRQMEVLFGPSDPKEIEKILSKRFRSRYI